MKKTAKIARRRDRKRLRRITTIRMRSLRLARMTIDIEAIAPKVYLEEIKRNVRVLKSPKKINLSDSYQETIEFLGQVGLLARGLKGRFHVDLTSVEEITPAGALLLVAAFDRWKKISPGQRLKAISLKRWNPDVRRKLKEMGFFEILGAQCEIIDPASDVDDRYLPFLTGEGSEGEQAKHLRKKIEEFGPELADRGSFYDGLVEAMTNVRQHAYPPNEKVRKWWMSASVNVARNKLTVMFLDHGLGIPATLPRSKGWEQVRGVLASFASDALKDDANLIRAALSVEKSSTGLAYRGNGLRQDIRGYVETHQAHGRLRVLSKKGKCVYEKITNGQEKMLTERLTVPLHGTFIEWSIEEYAANEDA